MTDRTGSGPGRRPGLEEWGERAAGRLARLEACEALEDVLHGLFGYHLLLAGDARYASVLGAARVQHYSLLDWGSRVEERVRPGPGATPGTGGSALTLPGDIAGRAAWVRAAADALPFLSDEIDVVVLPHLLELVRDPHAALREVSRVLVPEGHAIVIGFNPWAWLGVGWPAGRTRLLPATRQRVTVARLRDWLSLLGFEVVRTQSRYIRPPFGSERLLERMRPVERLAGVLGPWGGWLYLMVGRKRRSALTPLRPKARASRRLVAVGLAEPAAREVARTLGRPAGGKDGRR